MRRSRFLAVIALIFAVGAFAPVIAQEEAPAADQPAVGVPLVYVDEAGVERGLVTVTELEDPFEGFPEGSEPSAGARYVLLTVTFENTGQQPFEVRPDHLLLQDADGFLWGNATVRRGDDVVIPDLQRQQMAPGSRISGVVGFQVPAAAELAKVFYQPQRERLILLADLLPAAPKPDVGSEVRYQDAEGGERALVTVSAVEDPFADFAEGSDPGPDSRYVLLTVAVDNTGSGPFEVRPDQMLLRDTDGFLWGQTSVRRGDDIVVPDLQRQQMAPGNRISGVVGFRIPADAEVAEVLYQPESSRLILLANLQPDAAPVVTPVAAGDARTATLGNDCAELEPWLIATTQRFVRAIDMSQEAARLEDPATLELLAAEYLALAEAQQAMDVPASVTEINASVVAILTAYHEALTQITTAGDDGGDITDALVAGMNAFNDAGRDFDALIPQLLDLATNCGINV